MTYQYKLSIVGGTFDRFHIGHKSLIDSAFRQSDRVIIGIADKNLIKHKFLLGIIEDYTLRRNSVLNYLKEKKYLLRSSIIPIHDFYGNSLEKKDIQAVFVTKATLSGARSLNTQREKIGFDPLEIVMVPYIKGSDRRIVTSERIRCGEIDREGNEYMKIFKNKKRLTMPDFMRELLRKPIGIVLNSKDDIKKLLTENNNSNTPFIAAVGDIVSKLLLESGCHPDLCIIDFKTRRKLIDMSDIPTLFTKEIDSNVKNYPGVISKNAVNAYVEVIKKYLQTGKKQIMVVDGEEDLLTLPVVLLAPINSLVFYGQYETGTIAVKVTEEKKKEIRIILEKFN